MGHQPGDRYGDGGHNSRNEHGHENDSAADDAPHARDDVREDLDGTEHQVQSQGHQNPAEDAKEPGEGRVLGLGLVVHRGGGVFAPSKQEDVAPLPRLGDEGRDGLPALHAHDGHDGRGRLGEADHLVADLGVPRRGVAEVEAAPARRLLRPAANGLVDDVVDGHAHGRVPVDPPRQLLRKFEGADHDRVGAEPCGFEFHVRRIGMVARSLEVV
mmetsp:Transcript_3844/g.8090  ORF Transcript_3844/g.8090 Transcript_3844/m.8090 type:complete len:214 (-) Transcript_3844:637-1278(-)